MTWQELKDYTSQINDPGTLASTVMIVNEAGEYTPVDLEEIQDEGETILDDGHPYLVGM